MADSGSRRGRTELLPGTLEMLVLQTLHRGEHHGYGISQAIGAGTGDLLRVETGSLYPALHRLEKRRLIKATWKTSDNNQRARYYCLTPAGSRHLAREESRWAAMVQAIAAMSRPRRQEG